MGFSCIKINSKIMLQQSSCPSISLVKKLSLNQIMECLPLAMDLPHTILLQSSPMIPLHMKPPQALMELPQAHMVLPQAHMVFPQAHMVLPQAHMVLPQAHMVLPLMSLCHHTNQLQVKDKRT